MVRMTTVIMNRIKLASFVGRKKGCQQVLSSGLESCQGITTIVNFDLHLINQPSS